MVVIFNHAMHFQPLSQATPLSRLVARSRWLSLVVLKTIWRRNCKIDTWGWVQEETISFPSVTAGFIGFRFAKLSVVEVTGNPPAEAIVGLER